MLVIDLVKGIAQRLRGEGTPADEPPESRPLHVCHVVERLALGGIAARLIPVCNGLDTDEFLVSCLSLGERERLVLEELEPRVQTWGLSFVPWSGLGASLIELFRRFQVDVVHTHAGALGVVAAAARAAGVRALIHTNYGESEPLPTGAVTLTAASTPVARSIAEMRGCDVAEIQVLPCGVDTERFRPPLDRGALREGLGLDSSTVLVGTVALTTEARLSLSVLVSTLRGRGIPATGLLVGGVRAGSGGERKEGTGGDGPRAAHLPLRGRQYDREAGTRQDLLLETGPTRAVASRLAAMDLLVVTGRAMSAPISLLEGMASGLPVVAARSPGVLDVCGDEAEDRGVVVVEGGLEHEVERLARDPDLRRHLGERARRFAERKLQQTTVVEAYTSVYRGLGLDSAR